MKKYYVSLETAKLLKEKKFNSWCEWAYEVTNDKVKVTDADYLSHSNSHLPENCYSMAFLYQVQLWLREEYEMDVVIYPMLYSTADNDTEYLIGYRPWICWHPKGINTDIRESVRVQLYDSCPTYEDAFDKGLRLALTLI